MSRYRPEKIGQQIFKELTRLLNYQSKDPRLSTVTLTGVDVTRDIGLARVYFTVSDIDSERLDAERALKKAAPYLRRELGRAIQLRSLPELRFQYDDTLAYGQRIDHLLRQVQDDLGHGDEENH